MMTMNDKAITLPYVRNSAHSLQSLRGLCLAPSDAEELLSFTSLTRITLRSVALAPEKMSQLLFYLSPSLRALHIPETTTLKSLQPLSMCVHLEELDITKCTGLRGDELKHLTDLQKMVRTRERARDREKSLRVFDLPISSRQVSMSPRCLS